MKYFVLFLLLLSTHAWAADPMEGTGLPVPRFASLKSGNAFIRTGPSMDYPIKWIYKKAGLPVEIVQEYDAWRKIKDPAGDTGWVHKLLLSGQRTAVIQSKEPVKSYAEEDKDQTVALLEPGVMVHLAECREKLCRAKFTTYEGWIEKKYLWGVYPADLFH